MRRADYCLAGVALLTAAVALTGCASREQVLLERFFDASRLRDITALQTIATVTFEPLQQGIVRTFQVVGVTAERQSGAAVTKEVTVDARIALADGQVVQRTLVVTMQRDSRSDRAGPWMVTRVTVSLPAPPVPRS